jgi:hypothetical protein
MSSRNCTSPLSIASEISLPNANVSRHAVFGVKLLGVRAAARRRAIFALAGFDEARQAEWEAAGTPQARDLLVRKHAARMAAGIHPAVFAQSQAAQHV